MRRTLKRASAVLAVLTATTVSATAFEQIKGGVFKQVSNITLSKDAQRSLNRFRRDNAAYGAYFVSADGSDWAWYGGLFSQADADKSAKALCEVDAGAPCTLFARITPGNAVGKVAMPASERAGLREALRDTTSGRFGALAAYPLGGWGSGFDFDTAEGARERATLECAAAAADDRASEDSDVRKAFDRNRLYDCKVVHVFQKQ